MAEATVLELRGVTKRFPGVVANDHVDFDLRQGEVHALLGENGAGKSTLMNILFGLSKPDEGEIRMGGRPVSFASAKDAIEHGIGMVHQHFMLIPVMTVAENIVLAAEPRDRTGLLDERAAERRVREISRQFGLAVNPGAKVEAISVGQQQRVEILKALYRGARVLILDEPTAVLTPQEAGELFAIIRSLREQGTSIVFITHKLREVLEIADRITVLRRGRKIDTVPREGATEDELARLMVGRDVLLRVDKPPATPGEVALEVRDLHVRDDRGLEQVRGVSLTVRRGEIVALAGVDGNGQTELVEAITGLRPLESGTVAVGGFPVTGELNARKMLDAGVGHIPEDRQRRGLVLEFTLAENIALHDYNRPPDARLGWLYPKRLVERAARLIRDFDVRGGGPLTRASALSGGNQQKVVVAREVARDPTVLIAAQPTRGLDVGAIEYVHRRLVAERDAGAAILLVSLELDEVLSLADRILVVYEGRIVGEHGAEAVGATAPPEGEPPAGFASRLGVAQQAGGFVVPLLTAVLAFLIGGVVVAATGHNPWTAYKGIFEGAGLNWFFHVPWDTNTIDLGAFNLSQTLILTTTLILTGLAVALPFRCGLFNIGGQGQYLAGLIVANWIGISLAGTPSLVHVLLGIVLATAAGAVWAGIAGFLKATTGAHEVISTIMLNWIAVWGGSYLFGQGGPLQNTENPAAPISADVAPGARLPVFWGSPQLQGLHVGFFVALAMLVVFYLLLNRTTVGYEIRATGFNPAAAAYGGISVRKNYILAMAISGGFAGLAGALDMLGYLFHFGTLDVQASQIGFLGIAVALLGRNTAIGTGLAALLFGSLLYGTTRGLDPNVFDPSLAGNLTSMIQGLIVLFVGADIFILYLWNARRNLRRREAVA
jgi:simple sugar transport system ATP-binding protein